MLENSNPGVMLGLLDIHRLRDNTSPAEFFTFGYDFEHGKANVGFGGARPFKVGITTKLLMENLARDPSTYTFHWDGTYKLNTLDYPVIVCGVSDIGRQFHPVAFFVVGRESEDEFSWALQSVQNLYEHLFNRELKLVAVMGDACEAAANALKNHRRDLGWRTLLMCFYHVISNVKKRFVGLSLDAKARVYRHLYNIHYSRNRNEMLNRWQDAQTSWAKSLELTRIQFTKYFKNQWMKGDFKNWQVYHSAAGFAATNNPCEIFNKILKGATGV